MKTCENCNNWIDQPAPNGQQLCDECYVSLAAQKQPAMNRAKCVTQAREKQFKAMVKYGGQSLLDEHAGMFQTIHNYDRFCQRKNAIARLSDRAFKCSAEYMRGWLKACFEMRENPLLLCFCPNWAFWHDDDLTNEYIKGEAAAYRALHKI